MPFNKMNAKLALIFNISTFNLPNFLHLSNRQRNGQFAPANANEKSQFFLSAKPYDFEKAMTIFTMLKTSSFPEDPFNEAVFEGSIDLTHLIRVDIPHRDSEPALVKSLIAASNLGPRNLINQNQINESDLSHGLSREDLIAYF